MCNGSTKTENKHFFFWGCQAFFSCGGVKIYCHKIDTPSLLYLGIIPTKAKQQAIK
ncbi:hypothetical protein BDA99DRAFT_519012 [Phascolomyces articulosus]|uniref:Uncharacterized protein n=1 Tax=Phascolomyces articulosus TaxID=60185 RepID=A0AAD5K3J1_9FUNG|nr:hypothetical protein BDA99DRAFT_519012 [Phascolomyces articulosus]